jgi:hypothetical protein
MGHSHHPGIQKDPQGNFWINCGSVGYPFLKSPDPSLSTSLPTSLPSFDHPRSNWVEVKSLEPRGELRRLEVNFHEVSYDGDSLVREWVESEALEKGSPFSWAILAQSLFNEDITYPLFRRGRGLSTKNMELFFEKELERLALKERILDRIQDKSMAIKVSRIP